MSKKNLFVLILVLFTLKGWAQSYVQTSSGIVTTVKAVKIKLEFYSPSILRVLKVPGESPVQKISLSVTVKPRRIRFSVIKKHDVISITTDSLKVKLDLITGKIGYYTIFDKLLMAEAENGTEFTPVKDLKKNTYNVMQMFQLPANDAIYGLGQHQDGVMNFRNRSVTLRQQNMEIGIPFILTSGGYGLFWDNYSETTFNDAHGNTSFQSVVGDVIDYYFIDGNNADGVIAGMRTLTGNVPMFPKWVFGFWQSRERYKSQTEVVNVVRKYRELKVPLDGIVQDWQYWGQEGKDWNAISFGNPLFSSPAKMVDSVHRMHAHIIISVWPSFGENTAIYKELKKQNLLLDFKSWPETSGVRVYDAFNPAAREIYWKYINANLFSIGIDGWWLDATEPEQHNIKQSDSAQTFLGSFKSLRNAFPLVTNGGVYEHQRIANPNKRVFIITRSAFAGQQRYATMTWSGDINSTWDVFRKQISGGLNLSLSDIPYWNTDIGGFYSAPKYPEGVKDPAFCELYTRWLEFGTFTSLFRSHGTNTPREIFQFGKKGDWAYDAQEKFINLRYRLIPYIYSAAWQVTAHSSTLMRALVMDFAADTAVYNINNEYMFGNCILVAPVTDSMYTNRTKGATTVDFSQIKTKQVYLPKGSKWVNFWTGETYTGGSQANCNVPIDQMPLFIKSGSILPLAPIQQYTLEHKPDTLELRIYEGADGKFTLYEDENDNYNYEKGKNSTINIIWNDKKRKLTIDNRKGSFTGMLKNRVFEVVLITENNGTMLKPIKNIQKSIHYAGKKVNILL